MIKKYIKRASVFRCKVINIFTEFKGAPIFAGTKFWVFLRLVSKSQTLVAAFICAREIRPILQPNLVVAVSKIAQF